MNIASKELDNSIQLISREDAERDFGEAAASVMEADAAVTWAKFTLTDDRPDLNKQRVPEEEFDNLIKTGLHKPVKMAVGEIKDGHEDAHPLGTITNLTRDGNKIVALAALWSREREDDIALIKERVKANKPVNVSWEILYRASQIKNGIQDLLDTTLRAVTIVGMPAYAGRTQILAVAAKEKWSPDYITKLPDNSFMYIKNDGTRYFAYRDDTGKIDPSRFPVILNEIGNTPLPQNTLNSIKRQVQKMKGVISADASIKELLGEEFVTEEKTVELKELEGKVSELEAKLALASEKLTQKEAELAVASEKAAVAETAVKTLTEEIDPLREFKLEADNAADRQAKLSAIKAKFESAKLEKPDEYFEENAEKLLGLDDNGLDFMLQEMVAFKSDDGKGESEASVKKITVPNIIGKSENLSGPIEIAKALTELRKNAKK
jgi:hypothetical protein